MTRLIQNRTLIYPAAALLTLTATSCAPSVTATGGVVTVVQVNPTTAEPVDVTLRFRGENPPEVDGAAIVVECGECGG